jgi:Chaperone for flagella basal body P-ring formation
MNPFLTLVLTSLLTLLSRLAAPATARAATSAASAAPLECGRVVVESSVEVAGPEFALSDLLAPHSCPALVQAAARVHLGAAPLTGSERVLEGERVRAALMQLGASAGIESESPSQSQSQSRSQPQVQTQFWTVPERITVRRAGQRASCADLSERIRALLPAAAARALSGRDVACGATARLAQSAPLAVLKTAWNPGLDSWEIWARCVRPADCVPFLVRVRAGDGGPQKAQATPPLPAALRAALPAAGLGSDGVGADSSRESAVAGPGAERPLVRPGQTATLVWDQDGIRLVIPVVCLDPGGPGEAVRARILRGGRVVRAIVVNETELRAAS